MIVASSPFNYTVLLRSLDLVFDKSEVLDWLSLEDFSVMFLVLCTTSSL